MLYVAKEHRTRAGYIAGLRLLADLLEQVPEVPHYDQHSIGFALGGTEAEAFEAMDRAADALTAAGIEFDRDVSGIDFVLAGLEYRFSRLPDAVRARYAAQCSYEGNVQVA